MSQSERFENRAVQGDHFARGDSEGRTDLPIEGERILQPGHDQSAPTVGGPSKWRRLGAAHGPADDVVRPNPLQWLRYVYTGSVPTKNRAWVLYDASCPTWILRHMARYLVLIAPLITLVMVFLPAPLSDRVLACVAAGGAMLIGYLAFTTESLERRVEKAGYPNGLAGRLREQRSIDAQRAVAARSRQRHEDRLRRRRA